MPELKLLRISIQGEFLIQLVEITIPNSTFSSMIYSGDGNYLVTGATVIGSSLVLLFNTTSGQLLNTTIFTTPAPISKFSVVNNNKDIVALDTMFNVYQGTTLNSISGQSIINIATTTAFTGCPSASDIFVSGNMIAPSINVYNANPTLSFNYFQQFLVASTVPVKSLDCSKNYLISLDIGNTVSVTSYSSGSSTISSTLAGGIIALIVICAILIAAAIGVIVFFCMKMRKMGA